QWYPGDGRVLPLEEALKLVSVFVRQEMRLRVALVSGDAVAASPVSLAGVPSTTEALLSSRWEAGLESAASPLLSFLQGMGAQHLCVRVVAGMMALPPPSAVEVLGDAFSGLADKVMEFNHIDCPLAIGYMLAMPTRQAYDTFRRIIRYSSDDYGRLRILAGVGMYAARAWDNHDLLHQCMEVERDSHWWHVLTNLGITFDNRGFSRADRSQVPGEYQKSLVPALLERSGCDLGLALEFCERYGVGEAFPCLLYVDNQLGLPCVSPHDASYQVCFVFVFYTVLWMLRHMLETPGMICDRDYERLAFVYGTLLSDKCQEEEEDSEEEVKRLEDSLEALAILKDYTSPWPLDVEGRPVAAVAEGGEAGARGGGRGEVDVRSSTAPPTTVGSPVYARRLPFMALVKDPWAVLEVQLRPDSVSNLVPLADPLGLGVGEFYSRLVAGMLNKGTPLGDGDGASPPGPVPTFSTLQPWLEKIKNPALACTTAQRVAASMTRDEDRLEALQAAIGHAITAAGSLDDEQDHDKQHPENRPRPSLALLPLPSLAAESTADNNNQDPATKAGAGAEVEEEMEEAGGDVEAEIVVDRLQRRALRLEHLMTAKACVGADMAERLSPFLLSGSTELLMELLVVAAESAADAALALPPTAGEGGHHHSAATEWMATTTTTGGSSSSSTAAEAVEAAGFGGGNMSDFRRRATGALQAARSVADQRGMDPHDVETIIFRLAKNWICQHKLGGGGGSTSGHGGGPAAVAGERDAGMFVGAGLVGGGGGGGGESVFVKDAREERMLEDATLALRAAFVLTVTFSDDAVDGDTSVCDSISFMDLKSRISVLLSIAKDGRRDGRSNRL
ncbi:unnamed protein product, partial [Ectocarpus sp. 8 AP-2014]